MILEVLGILCGVAAGLTLIGVCILAYFLRRDRLREEQASFLTSNTVGQ